MCVKNLDYSKKTILYICINNGSDMRITKEIKTLHSKFNVLFLGIGIPSDSSFALKYCNKMYLIKGSHKSPIVLMKLMLRLVHIRFKYVFEFVHVVDEQLYFFLIPFLIRKKVILDIFDSIFLKWNKPNEQFGLLKKLIYGSASSLIVTDDNRKNLLPKLFKEKAIIIPNVPFRNEYDRKASNEGHLTICYFGTLLKDRGSEFAFKLLEHNEFIRLISAGWIGDKFSEELMKHSRVKYLGILEQHKINNILASEGDYLLSIYPYKNTNNINASPNKIYDAIHTRTPVVINEEIKISQFVRDKKIGLVVNLKEEIDFSVLGCKLKDEKNSYQFNEKLIAIYSWENYEMDLLELYN